MTEVFGVRAKIIIKSGLLIGLLGNRAIILIDLEHCFLIISAECVVRGCLKIF